MFCVMILFSGFISKILFAQAAVNQAEKMLPTLIALALSTILNVIYFMRAVLVIYTPQKGALKAEGNGYRRIRMGEDPGKSVVLVCFMLLNLVLVIVFRLGVAGVGIATTVANVLSAVIILSPRGLSTTKNNPPR